MAIDDDAELGKTVTYGSMVNCDEPMMRDRMIDINANALLCWGFPPEWAWAVSSYYTMLRIVNVFSCGRHLATTTLLAVHGCRSFSPRVSLQHCPRHTHAGSPYSGHTNRHTNVQSTTPTSTTEKTTKTTWTQKTTATKYKTFNATTRSPLTATTTITTKIT